MESFPQPVGPSFEVPQCCVSAAKNPLAALRTARSPALACSLDQARKKTELTCKILFSFEFRLSDLFRISNFEFRISLSPHAPHSSRNSRKPAASASQ